MAPGVHAQVTELPEGPVQYLRPGDVVRLQIWREPDLEGDYLVDETGTVVFPRVGEYTVLEDTSESLKARLIEDFQQYLRNPSIDVIVLKRVRITGAVVSPGLHLVDPTVMIADALAMAGGPTPLGEPEKVRILRDGQVIALDIRQDMLIADSPLRSGDQLYVPERSWVARNSNVVATVIAASVSLVIAVFVR